MKFTLKFKNLFLIFLTISLIFLSACSSNKDCSSYDTTYEKYNFDENTKECIVYKTIEKNKPDNGVIEDGENYCNAPNDVSKDHPTLGCEGEIGDYIEKACNNKKECVYVQNNKVIENTITKQLKNSDVVFDVRVTYNDPFVLNVDEENKFEFDLTLFNLPQANANIKNLEVKEIKLEDASSKLLGNIVYNQKISKIGDKLENKKITLSETNKYEIQESIRLRFIVSYTKETLDSRDGSVIKTEDKIETLSETLPRIKIINPNFFK